MKRLDLLFVCGGKDFHAMDKFKLAFAYLGRERVLLVTDTVQGEGQTSLIEDSYPIEYLYVIDWMTPNYQSSWTHVWRNFIKFILLPIQAKKLKGIYDKYQPSIVHAVPMYYMVLCWYAKIPFVGTPQAAEIVERPKRSWIYKRIAKRVLLAANQLIVDSNEMKEILRDSFSCPSIILKNGFKTASALSRQSVCTKRFRVLSVRGFQSNYQIHRIIEARDYSRCAPPLDLIFPFFDKDYLERVKKVLRREDTLRGLLSRDELYRLMGEALLVVSIPTGDSSPRSVYESIFCGAAVAITRMGFYDEMPACMQSRVYIVNFGNPRWFDEAVAFAKRVSSEPFHPSEDALKMCDQDLLFQNLINSVYFANAGDVYT